MSIFSNDSGSKEDNRRTIIAVIMSTVVVGVGFMIQNALFPPSPQTPTTVATQTSSPVTGSASGSPEALGTSSGSGQISVVSGQGTVAGRTTGTQGLVTIPVPTAEERYTISTDDVEAVFTNAGGNLVSLKLKKHKDRYGSVDLIVPGSQGSEGLALAFGDQNAKPVTDLMSVKWLDADHRTIEFSRTFFATPAGGVAAVPFTLKKAFTFHNGEYMFGMAITLENSTNQFLPLDSNGIAYSIELGPQIGPRFDNLPKNADYRKYIIETDNKKKVEMVKPGVPFVVKDKATWAALAGKYFTFIAIPEAPFAGFTFLQGQDPTIKQTDYLTVTRPTIKASNQTDTYYFFFGPKTSAELSKYEYKDKNAYGLSSMRLEDAMERSNILGWLENILKFFLNIFYSIIPNYGVAIILVTILIKGLFFPLTKKGSISTARMQELQPKIQELQAKYKSNPQKLNQEMADFYKRENYNPMSGCLPMLIQFPIFIAMYNLFNNHFDLRGAVFISGWINDLSLPESIIHFTNFQIPIVGWSDLRALPIIYLASQLLYGKFTQTPQTGQSANQMKLMMYGMPIMFFFILYDVPSGLLIYWIANNILTIGQQIVINDMLKKHKLARAEAALLGGGQSGPSSGSGSSGNRDASRNEGNAAKNAGKTKVRASPMKRSAVEKEGFSEKVRNWLESKAEGAKSQGAANDKTSSGKTGKNRQK
jgi:YidC/Oxa1 family membrane protein insertase